MATTLATEKQARAIKHRMAEIRTNLPYHADEARLEAKSRVKQLTDWKYHMTQHPLPILAATAVAGYLLVPAKRSTERIIVERPSPPSEPPVPVEKGMLGGIAGAVATMAVKQAAALAMNQVSHLLSQRGGDS